MLILSNFIYAELMKNRTGSTLGPQEGPRSEVEESREGQAALRLVLVSLGWQL
jgi:hypothetical protein